MSEFEHENMKPLGRGHRESIKTAGYIAFKADCDKTNSLSDARIRGKRVRDEETELLAKEGSQAVLKEREAKRAKKEEKRAKKEEKKAKKEEEKEKKRRAKGKGTEVALVTTRDSDGTADNTDELLRVAEVIKDETRCKELIILLHHCTGAPRSKLQTMDLDELEDAWAKASKSTVAQAVPSSSDTDKTDCTAKTAKGSVSKSQASTSKPKATPKPAFETPAKKLTASKVMPNKVSMVGSPLVAFEEAQAQSARAAQPTPVPKKRKLDGPVDRTESVQRLRLDKPLPQVTAVSKSQSSTSTASASSKAPSPPPARSESFALSSNNKMGSNNDGGPGIDPDEEKPTRGGGGPRQRPTMKAMKNTIEGMITDIAVDRIWTGLVPNMCLESDEYALAILNGWRDAVEELGSSVKDYPLSADSKSVIRGLISSNRSRGRKRVAEALVDYFKLRVSPTNSLDNIKSRAAELKPTEFHCDSTETNKRAGAYRSPFISRALSAYWYTGPNSPGLRHPEALKPVPIEAIAFICGLSEDVLGGLERDGQLLTEVKAKKGEGQGRRAAKKPKEDIVPRANLDAVKPLMAVHLRNLQMFRTTLPGIFEDYRYTLHNDALKHVGKPASEPKPEVDSDLAAGALTADAFADEVDIPIAEVKRRHGSENPTARQPVSKPRQKVAPIPEHRQLPTVPEETSDSSSDSGSDSSSSSSSSSGSGSSFGSSSDSSSESSSSRDQDFGNNPSPTRKLVNPNTDHVYEPLDSMYDEVAPEEPGDVNEDAAPPEENREGGEQEGEDREKGDQEEEKVGDEWKEGTEASGEKDGSKDRVEEKATATVQGREKPNKDAQGIPPGHSMHEAPAELCGEGDPAKTCGPPPGPTSTPPPDTTLSPPLAPSPKAVPLATRVTRLTTKGTAPLGNMQVSPSRAAGVNARQDAQAKSGQKTEQKQPGKTKGAPKANRAAENRAAKAAKKAAKEAAEEETGAKKPKPKRGKKA